MRFDFSSDFLRIVPPDTTFGEAWESLCEILLREELGSANILRLRPPDRGIDILYRPKKRAFQCKSTERGAYGRINSEGSIRSLDTAIRYKQSLEWVRYCFATNADYTGAGYERILTRAKEAGIKPGNIEFMGPIHWDQQCTLHSELVKDRFDYRVSINEKRFLEALQATGRALGLDPSLKNSEASVIVTNNLTQTELEVPMVNDLWINFHLAAMMFLHGLTESWQTSHLGIPLTPLASLRFRGKELNLFMSLKDAGIQSGDSLELHIKVDEEALGVFERLLNQHPGDMSAGLGKAEILMSHGRFDEALITLDGVISRNPNNEIPRIGRAEILKAQGRYAEALAAYTEITSQYPESVLARNGYAEILKDMGKLTAALAVYDEVISQYREGVVAKSGRAEVLKTGDKNVESPDPNRREPNDVESRTTPTEPAIRNPESILQNRIWREMRRLRKEQDQDNNPISMISDRFSSWRLAA
jgi:tetratricopeptide (TPR) repeat protein